VQQQHCTFYVLALTLGVLTPLHCPQKQMCGTAHGAAMHCIYSMLLDEHVLQERACKAA
jgi:hypothetical protein